MHLQARLLSRPPCKEDPPTRIIVPVKVPSTRWQYARREHAHVNITNQLDVNADVGVCSHGDDANLARVRRIETQPLCTYERGLVASPG